MNGLVKYSDKEPDLSDEEKNIVFDACGLALD